MRYALVIIALFAAQPASAQIWGGTTDGERMPRLSFETGRHQGILQQSKAAINQARESGQITRVEARQLKREHDRIMAVQRRMDRDGLTPSEQRALEQQALALQGLINARRSTSPTGG